MYEVAVPGDLGMMRCLAESVPLGDDRRFSLAVVFEGPPGRRYN